MSSPFDPVITEIRGEVYPSMTAASKAIGVTVWTIAKAMNEGRLETVGLWGKAGKPRSGRWRGVWYPSITAAARAANVPPSTFSARIHSGRDEWVFDKDAANGG